jgi:hypothetical protein
MVSQLSAAPLGRRDSGWIDARGRSRIDKRSCNCGMRQTCANAMTALSVAMPHRDEANAM